MIDVPPRLSWLSATPDGAAWLGALPGLVAEVAARWSLTLGDPFTDGFASLACPAQAAGWPPAVLKLQYPHPECRTEADALRTWGGAGAVQLFAHDRERHALLVERCRPGTPLTSLADAGPADAALDVLADLLPRSWVALPAQHPFDDLATVAAGWLDHLPAAWDAAGRPFDRRLVDAALGLGADLIATTGGDTDRVLANQDLHAGNVLAAEREPWLTIDPKPVAGERAFGLAPVVRAFELGATAAEVHHRLDRLSAELDVDRERAAAWSVVQAVAWGVDAPPEVAGRQVATATSLLDGPVLGA